MIEILSLVEWLWQDKAHTCLLVHSTRKVSRDSDPGCRGGTRAEGHLHGGFGRGYSGFRTATRRPYRFPRNTFSHQRVPTKRKRQSLKNSGGLPSMACPANWKIHPIVKRDSGIFQNPRTK